MTTFKNFAAAAAVAALTCTAAAQQATPPYGTPISLEQAKKVIAAGEARSTEEQLVRRHHGGRYRRVRGGYPSARQHTARLNPPSPKTRPAQRCCFAARPRRSKMPSPGVESDCEFSDCAELLLTTAAFQFSSMANFLVRWACSGMLPQQDGQVANAAASAMK